MNINKLENQTIKEEEPEVKEETEANNEPEFTLDDLPEHLRPSSLLVEVFEQLSGLKDSIVSTKEKEDEL